MARQATAGRHCDDAAILGAVNGGRNVVDSGGLDDMLHPNVNIMNTSPDNGPVTLKRNRAGHFEAPGQINGEPVTFLLDTGATYVAVPSELAKRLSLAPGRQCLV